MRFCQSGPASRLSGLSHQAAPPPTPRGSPSPTGSTASTDNRGVRDPRGIVSAPVGVGVGAATVEILLLASEDQFSRQVKGIDADDAQEVL